MKVVAIILILVIGQVLGLNHVRANSEYVASTERSAAEAESSTSGTINPFNALKYRSPPYVAPQKIQYTPPQQLNYVVQPTYKFLSQSTAAAPTASYDPPQQHVQYAAHNSYNMQQLIPKIAATQQKSYNPIHASSPTTAPYSFAGDVSSFQYTSPIVSYSNLGVLQQSVDKAGSPVAAQVPTRVQYQQQPSPAPLIPQQQPTYNQPQQLIYKPRFELQQAAYNSGSHQLAADPLPVPAPKLIYSQSPQIFVPVPRAQTTYQGAAQKVVTPASQQVVYTVPQQIAYTPAQTPHQAQPTHRPVYVVAPQYQLNSAGGQHA